MYFKINDKVYELFPKEEIKKQIQEAIEPQVAALIQQIQAKIDDVLYKQKNVKQSLFEDIIPIYSTVLSRRPNYGTWYTRTFGGGQPYVIVSHYGRHASQGSVGLEDTWRACGTIRGCGSSATPIRCLSYNVYDRVE